MKRKNEVIVFSIIVVLIISIIGVFTTIGIRLSKDSSISLPDFNKILSWFSSEEEEEEEVYVEIEEVVLKYEDVKYYPYQAENKKWGYVDENMNVVIEAKFDNATIFSEGIGLVEKDNRYRYISKDGNYIFDNAYYYARPFCGGYAMAEENGKSVLIDYDGEKICEIDEDIYVSNFVDGIATYKKRNKYGYIDARGNILVKAKYEYCEDFINGVAIVKDKDNYYLIGKNGKKLVNSGFDYIRSYENKYFLCSDDENYYLIDNTGKKINLLIDERDIIRYQKDGVIFRGGNNKCGFMDYEGNIVFEAEVDFVNKVINGISYGEIYNGSKYEIVCIDNKGNIIANYTELGYTDVNEWYGEINVLSSNEHEYLVDKMGNKIEDLNEVIVQFYGDFIILSKSDNTNTKVYSQKGKLLLELDDRYYINNTDLYGDDYEENILLLRNDKDENVTINIHGKIAK